MSKGEFSSQTEFLVDKTLFMKEVISQENRSFLITAPLGFGKTNNLNMLKDFLSIEVDDRGLLKTKENHNLTTDSRYFFLNSKITGSKYIMDDYFGKYPVISVSFECFATIRNFEDAIKFYKRAVHAAYKDHEYLIRSLKLSFNDRKFVRFWCDNHNYHMMSRQQVLTGLRELSHLLCRHFNGSRAWVLVDDYDSVIHTALVEGGSQFRHIFRFTSRLLNCVFNNRESVYRGVVTGVWPVSLFNSSDVRYQICTFLGDHRFTDFYGFTAEEVEELLLNSRKMNSTLFGEVGKRCGWYETRGKKTFSSCGVSQFLETGTVDCYSSLISRVNYLFKLLPMREMMDKLLKGEIYPMYYSETISEEDLLNLRSILLKPDSKTYPDIQNLFLLILLQEGLLVHSSMGLEVNGFENSTYVKISNIKIKEEINKQRSHLNFT